MAETLDTAWSPPRRLALWRIVVVDGPQLWPGSTASLLSDGVKDVTTMELMHAGYKDATNGGEIPPAAAGRRRRRFPDASLQRYGSCPQPMIWILFSSLSSKSNICMIVLLLHGRLYSNVCSIASVQ